MSFCLILLLSGGHTFVETNMLRLCCLARRSKTCSLQMVQTKLGQKRDKKIQQKVQKPAEIRDLARSGKKIQLETLSLFT